MICKGSTVRPVQKRDGLYEGTVVDIKEDTWRKDPQSGIRQVTKYYIVDWVDLSPQDSLYRKKMKPVRDMHLESELEWIGGGNDMDVTIMDFLINQKNRETARNAK